MPDSNNVTLSWDKTSFVPGDRMVATLAGFNTHTPDPTTTVETFGPVDVPLKSDSGVSLTVSAPSVSITSTVPGVSVVEQVYIDAPAGQSLTLAGRQFLVSADRKSLSATA